MNNKSKVYFIKIDQIEKINKFLPDFGANLGLKCHFGEEGSDAFLQAEEIKKVAKMLDYPPMLETTVLYRSERSSAKGHIELARRHGFDFADIDIIDGELGDDASQDIHMIDGSKKEYYLGKGLKKYDSLLVLSHFKGHVLAGFGGAIKNLAMGLASRRGKLDMHADTMHEVVSHNCISCGECIKNCPVEAISYDTNGKAFIEQDKCISCSKCIAVCPKQAIPIPWSVGDVNNFMVKLASYALAATKGRNCYYVNYLVNIVPECDCMGIRQDKLCEDIGILASSDPVAIDKASFDLTVKNCPEFIKHNGSYALKYGEKIGLGNIDYELINVS